ncbi:tyrosine-protein phosphatase [Psychromonas sp. Urea-02u-13]|uniref:tyrosine-protein phosphatase n=1 Tax=Psychromonas sp. Urea-02u-13 TaxID=2058326 RepID=UPI000C344BC0|nr:CpsB/CapC family capsule biosynthesis tyrosine phosphatase [Psychromonas sp. Urea-02u-13]PKG37344.1 histidinol-phosphatase [Psychromonas sp. Urea-02u-13]
MIDLHSHILAGIDDGASTVDDAIALVNHSALSGVTKVLATPHIHFGTFDNDLASIKKAFAELTLKFQKEQINTAVAYAAEVRICPEIILLAKTKQLPFMGEWQGSDLLLIEFPHSHIPPGSEKLIDWLIKNNIQPMIAHPERNRDLWKFPELLRPFKQRGCLLQITAASLLGDFGERSEKLAWQLIEAHEATIVASDMHNLTRRPCKMKEAFEAVATRCSQAMAERLFTDTPDLIFNSNPTIWTLK